jgi:alkylation response protein AidB-like acyl-CoA dehydrogenase
VGLLGLPYPEEYGGAGQPYEIYLQALEEVAAAWMTVGVGVSVHVMATYPMAAFGTAEQRATYLPEMIGGKMLGAYALSEAQAGSDISAMTTRAKHADHGYELNGAKAWTTHGSYADFYTTFARTDDDPRGGVTCFHVPGRAPGLTFGSPEHKMGLNGSPTTSLYFDAVPIDDNRRIGDEGQGARIALSALDSGRLGIAACATGLAQAALDLAVDYAKQREQFGRPIAVLAGRDGGRGRLGPCDIPDGGPQARRRATVQPRCSGRQDDRLRCCDEGNDRRGSGVGRLRLHT